MWRGEVRDADGSRHRSGIVAVAVALVGALVLGGATSYLQSVLPFAVVSFASSAGGWTMVCARW